MKLIVFDADGTLVDSQYALIEAMRAGFRSLDLDPPDRKKLIKVAGLTPKDAFGRLLPAASEAELTQMALGYRRHYFEMHKQSVDGTALFPGVLETLGLLSNVPNCRIGLATGKSAQATDLMLKQFELGQFFDTVQCADRHPSKPHPSMLNSAMKEASADPENTIVVGDTSVDIQMATARQVAAIGVSWGFHSTEVLASEGAVAVINHMSELPQQIKKIWGDCRDV